MSLFPWRCSYSLSGTILQLHTLSQVPFTLVWAAHARARSVFPVPGGPYIRTPLGGCIPKFSNFSLWFIGRTMASTSYNKRNMLIHKPILLHRSRLSAFELEVKRCCPQSQQKLHIKYHLLDLFIQPPDVTVLLGGPLIHLHGLHSWIILSRQSLQDQVRVFVHPL